MYLDNIIEKIFIIDGESIYEYFFKSYYYKNLDKIYITRIHKKFEEKCIIIHLLNQLIIMLD
jgi:dihydrofolate reductase